MIFQSNLYGLIGYPLSHSFSKKYFTEKFAKENITDCIYELFPIESIDALPKLLSVHPNLRGLNVTIPYKELVLPYLHHYTESVHEIGACNCILIQRGEMIGHNTDVIGFEKMLTPHLKPHHRSALILGTGGAAKAVAWVLQKNNISYRYISRSKNENVLKYEEIDQYIIEQNTLIINTTPLGMSPEIDAFPPLPYHYLTNLHLCIDLIYNPSKTRFMEMAEAHGASILNGMEMLIIQAEESWVIWRGLNY